MYRVLAIFILIFILGCQNRNQVTHNKRKYRKGYYKPNRAKVRTPKGHSKKGQYELAEKKKEQQEVVAENNRDITTEPDQTRDSDPVDQDFNTDESDEIPEDYEYTKEASPDTLLKYPVYDKNRKHRKKVRQLAGGVFGNLLTPLPTFFLGLFVENFWWGVGILVCAVIGVALSIWYLIKSVKDRAVAHIVLSIIMLLVYLTALAAGILILLAL